MEKMTLRDYERKLMLERGGELSDDDEEEEELEAVQPGCSSSYWEQQKELKKA